MQESALQQILPKRGRSDNSFKKLAPIKFLTNYYNIELVGKQGNIYQYSFSLPDYIPEDSQFYSKAIQSIKGQLKKKIGYLAHSGQIIWGSLCLKTACTFKCMVNYQEKIEFQSIIKLTKQLNFSELNQKQTRATYIQLLNVSLKNRLKNLKLSQLGKRGEYFQKQLLQPKDQKDLGLNVLKGYRFTLTPLKFGIFLQVDYLSRVLQVQNLYEYLLENKDYYDEVCYDLVGKTVLAKYGTFRTYKIQQVDNTKTPTSVFNFDKKGVQMTYQQYYKEVYGLNVKNLKQPLVKAIKFITKQFEKGGKKKQAIVEFVYLIPQFLSLTGMTDQQKNSSRGMKKLAQLIKPEPKKRMQYCQSIINSLNQNSQGELIQIKSPTKFQGFILPRPQLIYQKNAKIFPNDLGQIKQRVALKQPAKFSDWLFVFKQRGKQYQQIHDRVLTLMDAAYSYKIEISQPQYLLVKGHSVSDWITQIKKSVEGRQFKIVFVLLQGKQQSYYGQLKKFITLDLKMSSQFARRNTFYKQNGFMAIASKIAIQMNIKVGSAPWSVNKGHQYFKNKKLIYGAFSISKGQTGYSFAFVGTTNDQCTKVYSECRSGIKSKQNISEKILQDILVEWTRAYYTANNKTHLPDLIILYRQGLSTSQIKSQIKDFEITALHNMIDRVNKATNKKFNPELAVVLANKNINSRYFNVTGQTNAGKIPDISNVKSGSVIIDEMSTEDSYDFHLSAQYAREGTSTPTLFRVAYNNRYPGNQNQIQNQQSLMPQEALITFTFEQCFNYYNWSGAVRVPACLQCADKLSKLVAMHIKADINGKIQGKENPVTKMHFFL